ncbi:MAG: hypothetical protein ACI4V7_02085 [Succinivibrionaceae bacterium]
MSFTGFLVNLVNENIITKEQADTIEQKAKDAEMNTIAYAVEWDYVQPSVIKELAIKEFGYNFLDLDNFDIKKMPEEYINQSLIVRTHAIPLYFENNTLYLGTSDPANFKALDEFNLKYGIMTDLVIVEEDKLTQKIQSIYGNFGTDQSYNL